MDIIRSNPSKAKAFSVSPCRERVHEREREKDNRIGRCKPNDVCSISMSTGEIDLRQRRISSLDFAMLLNLYTARSRDRSIVSFGREKSLAVVLPHNKLYREIYDGNCIRKAKRRTRRKRSFARRNPTNRSFRLNSNANLGLVYPSAFKISEDWSENYRLIRSSCIPIR